MDLKPIVDKILAADAAYYGTGCPIMTDQVYDAYKETVRSAEPDHPVLAKVGHPPSGAWKKVVHSIPMGSLDKVHSYAELVSWASKYPDQKYSMQYKLDGLSLSNDYENGYFERGMIRGDGIEGEDISDNIRLMQGYKAVVPFKFSGSIRVEAVLYKADLDRLNTILSEDDRYENCRNAAAGICRRQDGRFCQYLHLIAYDAIGSIQGRDIEDGLDEDLKLGLLTEFGFDVPKEWVGDLRALQQAFEGLKVQRKSLPMDIDGTVVKVCSKEVQASAGSSRGRPRAQIAWKFEAAGAATTFIEETWEVGRTGVITPLAHLEPVRIEGSTITKATLHNIAEIARLGIGRGDIVMVVKAGDVIPKITEVLEHRGQPIEIPTHCPGCNNALINDGVKLRCPNDSCAEKNFFRILNWIKVTKIDQFGESLAGALSAKGSLSRIEDIYCLTREQISELDGWGVSSAAQVMQNIDAKRCLPAPIFLAGIGIPSISERTADKLLARFGSIEALFSATEGDVACLPGFSDISAQKIIVGLRKFEPEIKALLIKVKVTASGSGPLAGQTFCFTGAMSQSRSTYQKMVVQNGGKNLSSVTKDLTYLVCNEDQGSGKSKKAKEYGTKVITEQEFLALVGVNQWQDIVKKPGVELPSLFEGEG